MDLTCKCFVFPDSMGKVYLAPMGALVSIYSSQYATSGYSRPPPHNYASEHIQNPGVKYQVELISKSIVATLTLLLLLSLTYELFLAYIKRKSSHNDITKMF